MSGGRKKARTREEMQRELSAIVEFESRDPIIRAAFPTVMDVQLSSDARYAKVYIAVGTDVDREVLLHALIRDRGFYRSELAARMQLRHTPELRFVIDETVERAMRLEQLLHDDEEDGVGGESPE